MPSAKQMAFAGLQWFHATRIPAAFKLRFGGLGTIFCLHSVPASKERPIAFMRDMDISRDFVEAMIVHYRARNCDIISLDEVRERLVDPKPSARRFVAFTFDDGYRNNFDVVYPLFEKHGAPFAVYVATALIEGTELPAWYILQDLAREHASLTVSNEGREVSLPTTTDGERERAFGAVSSIVRHFGDAELKAWLERLFARYQVDLRAKTTEHMMSWDMIRELARSKIATIGSHGIAHVPLKPLSDEGLDRELRESKRIIEQKTGVAVDHFGFPFGGYAHVGERECAAARDAGYRTAVTTRTGNIFPQHGSSLTALPRQVLSGVVEHMNIVETMESGFPSALLYGFRRVVTTQAGLKRLL